jgi:hypothetical protein
MVRIKKVDESFRVFFEELKRPLQEVLVTPMDVQVLFIPSRTTCRADLCSQPLQAALTFHRSRYTTKHRLLMSIAPPC